MPYPQVEEPFAGPAAFGEQSSEANLSQAAVLLLLGAQLRGDDYAVYGRAGAAGVEPFVEAIPAEDVARFPVPRLQGGGQRISFRHARFLLQGRFGYDMVPEGEVEVQPPLRTPPPDMLLDLAQRPYLEPDVLNAAQLMEACLIHPDELVRVANATVRDAQESVHRQSSNPCASHAGRDGNEFCSFGGMVVE